MVFQNGVVLSKPVYQHHGGRYSVTIEVLASRLLFPVSAIGEKFDVDWDHQNVVICVNEGVCEVVNTPNTPMCLRDIATKIAQLFHTRVTLSIERDRAIFVINVFNPALGGLPGFPDVRSYLAAGLAGGE